MAGINETKELVKWVCQLGNALGASLEDGKIGITDMFAFLGVLTSANAAFEGVEKVGAEIADIDLAEKELLMATIKAEFNIPQDEVEKYVESGIEAAAKLLDVYLLFKKLRSA